MESEMEGKGNGGLLFLCKPRKKRESYHRYCKQSGSLRLHSPHTILPSPVTCITQYKIGETKYDNEQRRNAYIIMLKYSILWSVCQSELGKNKSMQVFCVVLHILAHT